MEKGIPPPHKAYNSDLSRIRQIAPDSLKSDNTVLNQSPAVKVINSVLSLGMNYRTVVKPKLDAFQENNPILRTHVDRDKSLDY